MDAEPRRTERLASLGLLAGGIAHDFNNLLAVILAHVGVARVLNSNPAVDASLVQTEKAVDRARSLSRQILAFSLAEREPKRPVRLVTLIDEVVPLLRPTLPPAIELRTAASDPGWVLADPAELHQVLLNLCTNAAQALPAGEGWIELRVATAERQGERVVELAVSDSGQGMTGEVRQRLFEPFFTTKPAGTGLGLAIVQRIACDHGAQIEVESVPGQGTTFRVLFPVEAAPSPLQ